MDASVEMSVSGLTQKDGKKTAYVLFRDGKKTAEFVLPGCRLLKNEGFADEEVKSLRDYVDGEQDLIYAMAGKINPLHAFMEGGKQITKPAEDLRWQGRR